MYISNVLHIAWQYCVCLEVNTCMHVCLRYMYVLKGNALYGESSKGIANFHIEMDKGLVYSRKGKKNQIFCLMYLEKSISSLYTIPRLWGPLYILSPPLPSLPSSHIAGLLSASTTRFLCRLSRPRYSHGNHVERSSCYGRSPSPYWYYIRECNKSFLPYMGMFTSFDFMSAMYIQKI